MAVRRQHGRGRTGHRLGERLGLARPVVGDRRHRHLERGPRGHADGDDGALRPGVHAGDDGGGVRDREGHRQLLVGVGVGRATRRRPPTGATDHVESARPPGASATAAAVVRAQADRTDGGRTPRVHPGADRAARRARDGGRRRGVQPAHPRARHRPDDRGARLRRRHLPRLDLPQLPVGAAGQPDPRAGHRRHARLLPEADRGARGRAARRSRRRWWSRPRSTASRSTGSCSTATCCC